MCWPSETSEFTEAGRAPHRNRCVRACWPFLERYCTLWDNRRYSGTWKLEELLMQSISWLVQRRELFWGPASLRLAVARRRWCGHLQPRQLLRGQKERQVQFNKTKKQESRESITVGWCPQGNLEAKLLQLEDLLQIVIFEQQSKMCKSRNRNDGWQEPWLAALKSLLCCSLFVAFYDVVKRFPWFSTFFFFFWYHLPLLEGRGELC